MYKNIIQNDIISKLHPQCNIHNNNTGRIYKMTTTLHEDDTQHKGYKDLQHSVAAASKVRQNNE